MNDLLSDSFEIPRGQPSRGGDIELGTHAPMNAGDMGMEDFFKKVQEIDKQNEKLDKLLRKLQDSHEESKAVTKAPAMKAIKQRMEKDVDEVGKIARAVKTKVEELDRENLANRQKPGCGKGTGVDRSRTATTLSNSVCYTNLLCIMAEKKPVLISEEVPMMSEFIKHKLNGLNYYDWSRTVRFYLRSIDMEDHMTDDPPTDETKEIWLRDDARLFLQIKNSIEKEIVALVNHCEFVKELFEYLEFTYVENRRVNNMYDVCKAFYRAEMGNQSLTSYFMKLKKTYAEFIRIFPFSTDVKVQQAQREHIAIMSFLAGLSPEFEMARTQILSRSKILSLQEVFHTILHMKNSQSVYIPFQLQHNNPYSGRSNEYQGNKGMGSNTFENNYVAQNQHSGRIICHYCHKAGHMKRDCNKLLKRNQRTQAAHVASTSNISKNSVIISANEFAQFQQYQESIKASSITTFAMSGSYDEEDYW